MNTTHMVALLIGLSACGTPPAPAVDSGVAAADVLPSIRFVFPTSDLGAPVCPDFLVAVDIDNFEVLPPDPDADPIDGRGHWHLDDDITGDYFAVTDAFLDVTADLDGQASRNYRLTASLVNLNHTPVSLEAFPDSVHTVEFEVADSPDCLGDGGTTARR